MNLFEIIPEDKDPHAVISKNMADAAVEEARRKIKDQILFLKLNSKDTSIRHHLQQINEENKDELLDSITDRNIIDFNEVILKGNWREYLEKYKGEKLSKYNKETISDQSLVATEKDEERLNPAKEFTLSFQAMIKHYARNLELEEKGKNTLSERDELKRKFEEQLSAIGKQKPHIIAEIKNIDLNILRKPDYEAMIDLNAEKFQSYEEKLKSYFSLKVESKTIERSKEEKVRMVELDPRFRYYCALKQLVSPGPCEPHIFINEFNQNL